MSFNNSSDTSTLEPSVGQISENKDAKIPNESIYERNVSLKRGKQKLKAARSLSYADTIPVNLSISAASHDTLTLNSPSHTLHRSTSPVIPALPMYLRPESRILPANFQIPPEVFTDERLQKGFCRLSAIIKGHLTRRLMKTDRVQRIIGSMRDTMTIALQLHREAKQSKQVHQGENGVNNISTPTKFSLHDIDLHRRLLQQLYKDSQNFHDIFFKVHIKAIIVLFLCGQGGGQEVI